MISIIQRVSTAKVTVGNQYIACIDRGIVALVAIEREDDQKDAERLLERILNYRIFADFSSRKPGKIFRKNSDSPLNYLVQMIL